MPGSDDAEWVNWKRLCKRKIQHLITGYRIPVIEVDGDLGDIIEVFVRINSTGKALTPQEKRRAKYFNSAFLREADRLARRYETRFVSMGVLSAGQISRMKHVELVCELMLSIHRGDVINKKSALDRVMKTGDFNARDISKASRKTFTALNRIRGMFPKLRSTRFNKVTDFYSLVMLVARMEEEGLILTDPATQQAGVGSLGCFFQQGRRVKGTATETRNNQAWTRTVPELLADRFASH